MCSSDLEMDYLPFVDIRRADIGVDGTWVFVSIDLVQPPPAQEAVIYAVEIDPVTGLSVLYTDQVSAVLRYSADTSNTGSFPPNFVMALSYYLASLLAGPIIKGDAGEQKSAEMLSLAERWKAQALLSDANQRRATVHQNVAWITKR